MRLSPSDPSAPPDVPGSPARAITRHGDLFGHPRGLSVLFATEMWERFSYYGMRALLVLYLVKHLSEPGRAETVIGYVALRGALEAVFGPLGPQPFASHVYGLYTGLVYLTPILGGLVADRVLGQRRTVVLGAVLMALGHLMMAVETLLFPALAVLVLGSGAFKPNISTQIGALYGAGDPRRDRAFSIFYVGINLGAFLAPLVCGSLGERVGWHWGFGAAGIGMLIGLAVYLAGSRTLPPDVRTAAPTPDGTGRTTRQERRAVVALLLLCLPVTLFWATYEQEGNTVTLWADGHTDRTIALLGLVVEIPTTWFQALNPLMIFLFTPLLIELWAWQSRRGREPSTVTKMALGCFAVALANLVMAAATLQDGRAGMTWLVGYFAVLTLGELYVSPIGLSLVTKVAPPRHASLLMGVWLGTSMTGNLLSGMLGSLWARMDRTAFFLMIAALAALAAMVIAAARRALHEALGTAAEMATASRRGDRQNHGDPGRRTDRAG